MPILAVNVDHIATLRQARLAQEPDPVTAAHLAEIAGARAIIVHLREDRRHIQDRDVALLRQLIKTRLHLEMAATSEMHRLALGIKPDMVCLVPEKRQELTTEGGLAVAGREKEIASFLEPLHAAGIGSSLFIDPDPAQIEAAKAAGAHYIEIHTGAYADAPTPQARQAELAKVLAGIRQGRELGLKVNLGHGLNYDNIWAFAKVDGVSEYSIGHSIISRAVLTGMNEAVSRMAAIVGSFPDPA
ncbi:pyridoxine 5'-phosphate synthase [Fundidesulfovibrio agrisoli]|uniref:pyridoxine 5'-phosphate synthase n=1 Tax=Fundidesulfovibrio agrisoli TaxID=2922717 RepID=UPI001FAD4617|nr:pyridoxine 5'-phosphate synthase [Fundidesulfovibrio agrisoli]